MESLDGRVAWVTGAGSGIGQATAVALAEAGARVALSGRRKGPLSHTAAAIEEAGGEAIVEPVDTRDVDAVHRAAEAVVGRFGRIDILVNNAGVNTGDRHFETLRTEEWDHVVATNLSGAFYCVYAALPIMRRQHDGLIVNVSSWAGRYHTYLSGPAYNASKHGMLALNASINLEEGRNGIRACGICPGEVATPILDKRPVPVSAEDKARMLQPEDLAETIVFVARLPGHACVNEILISPTWNRLQEGAPAR